MSIKGTNIYKRKDGRWEARYVKSIEADGTKKRLGLRQNIYLSER